MHIECMCLFSLTMSLLLRNPALFDGFPTACAPDCFFKKVNLSGGLSIDSPPAPFLSLRDEVALVLIRPIADGCRFVQMLPLTADPIHQCQQQDGPQLGSTQGGGLSLTWATPLI